MKAFLLLIFSFLSIFGNSQIFENPSNIWVYGGLSLTQENYYVYRWGNDTEINGEPVKVLLTEYYYIMGYDNPQIFGPYTGIEDIYIKNDDNNVYVWDPANEEFDFLFDFDAQVGDVWQNNMWGNVEVDEAIISLTEENLVLELNSFNSEGTAYNYLQLTSLIYDIPPHNERIIIGVGPTGSFTPCLAPAEIGLTENTATDQCLGRAFGLKFFGDGENTLRFGNFSETEELLLNQILSTDNPHDQNDFEISIYPNPVKDQLKVKSILNFQSIRIFNAEGKLVTEIQNPTSELNVSNLASGFYFIQFNHDGKITNKKFIKE